MNSIRVKNLRSLIDTGVIELKPITLLVGANSSGKSTFLRTFPLLRQSVESQTLSGLLLNEGEVNFGSFQEALSRDANPAELGIEFSMNLKKDFFQGSMINRYFDGEVLAGCEIKYGKRDKEGRYPYIRSVTVNLHWNGHSDVICVSADDTGVVVKLQVNGVSFDVSGGGLRLKRTSSGIVPNVVKNLDAVIDNPLSLDVELGFFSKLQMQATNGLFHGRTSIETRLELLSNISIGSNQRMLEIMKSSEGVPSWRQSVASWTVASNDYICVRNVLIASSIERILTSININVTRFAKSINYFQPIRAGVQRDYAGKDVQLGNVDSSGVNVAMILSSMSGSELEKFKTWMRTCFGFEVFPRIVADGARIALRMKEEGVGGEFNLADMGFGFSQMLPFLVQMWMLVDPSSPRRNRNRNVSYRSAEFGVQEYLIAIEQPELHLHPALQARLADLFVSIAKTAKEVGVVVRFVLETHSQTIIERIGSLIEAGDIDSGSVQVLLFEKFQSTEHARNTKISHASFDESGALINWPFGFLSPPPMKSMRVPSKEDGNFGG